MTQLEQFLFEEACRLEQASALSRRAREFLKSSACSSPFAFRIARIVGKQRAQAREHIFRRGAALRSSRTAWRVRSRTFWQSDREPIDQTVDMFDKLVLAP